MEKRFKICLLTLLGLLVLIMPVSAMPPPLLVDITSITFDVSETNQESFTVTNYDDVTGTWDLGVDYESDTPVKWLLVDRDSVTLESGESQTVRIFANPAGLEDKIYQAIIVLTERSSNNTAVVSVTIQGPGSGQALALDREVFFFTRPGLTTAELEISNIGQGALLWNAEAPRYSSGAEEWLTLTPSKGVVRASGPVTVEASIDREGITPGFYQATVPIRSNGGDADVTIFMWVPPAASLSILQ